MRQSPAEADEVEREDQREEREQEAPWEECRRQPSRDDESSVPAGPMTISR
jgi:hypothetical protein